MRNIFRYIALIAASVAVFGCYPEVLEVDQDKLPQASELRPVISTNPETNEVTLSIENTDVTPIWIPGDVAINGKYNGDKIYKGTTTLVFNDKGEHVVELKAYNSYGISLGSQQVKFSFENEIPYDKGLIWWNNTEDTNKWLTANTSNRSYYYAPGWAQIADPVVEDSRHCYTVTLPEATTDQWQAQFAFNELGISTQSGKTYDFQVILNSTKDHPGVTVKLTQTNDDNVFYFADRHPLKAGSNYIYTMTEMEGKDIADLKLVFDFGGNEAGTVVAIKEIVFSEHQDDHAPYVSDEGNLWMDANIEVSFWFANESWGQIADPEYSSKGNYHKIIIPEGIGSQQWQGQFVFNNTGLNTTSEKGYSFTMKLKSTADHPGVTIKLTQQDNDGIFFFEKRHVLTAGQEYVYETGPVAGVDITNAKLVLDFGGGAAGSQVEFYDIALRETDLPGPPPPDMTVWEPYAETNLALAGNWSEIAYFFANQDWGQIADPVYKVEEVKEVGEYKALKHTVIIPEGAGSLDWQGQMAFNNIGIAMDASKEYDFMIVLHSTEAHPGALAKFAVYNPNPAEGEKAEGPAIYDFGRKPLPECEDVVFKVSKVTGVAAGNMMLILDMPGGVAGSKIQIKEITIQEHLEQ